MFVECEAGTSGVAIGECIMQSCMLDLNPSVGALVWMVPVSQHMWTALLTGSIFMLQKPIISLL